MKPWEKYAESEASKPWDRYSTQAKKPTEREKAWLARELSPVALKRGAGLAARTVTELATDIPTMLADIPAHLVNALGGGMPYSMVEQRDRLLAPAYGSPETRTEQLINVASRGAGSAGLSAAGAASALPRLAAAGTGSRVTGTLAARPALQMVSGAAGAGSSEVARQAGVGPAGQFAAGLTGALAPAVLAPRVPIPQTPETLAQRLVQQNAAAEAAARAQATARASPGVAASESAVQAAPEIRVSGGGMGAVGPETSAGLSIPQQRVAAEGKRLGMRLTPGQATGSKLLQRLEAKMESQPGTAGPFDTIKATNAKVLQRAAAQSIGESADTLDDTVLARAQGRISGVYESVADDAPRSIEPQRFLAFIGELQAETRGLVKGVTSHPLVEDVIALAQEGQATGRQLQNLTSKLGKAANLNMTSLNGDRELGMALFRVKDYVDDLLAQGLSAEKAKTFSDAREQYRNLILLTQRVGVVNPASGTVNPRSLASVLQSKDKGGYLYGRNQTALYNATRFAQAFQPIVGDSGTATRLPFQSIPDFMVRIPLNIASRAYTSSPAISVATGAQAGARAAGDYGRGLFMGPPTMPYAGIFAEEAATQ